MENLKPGEIVYEGEGYLYKFMPLEYVKHYYKGALTGEDDSSNGLSTLHQFFQDECAELAPDARLVDVGCGPTVTSALLGSRYFNNIMLCDFHTGNLQEIFKWKMEDRKAVDWSHFASFAATLEQHTNPGITGELIECRARGAIQQIFSCDLRQSAPLKNMDQKAFNVVVCIFCLEVTGSSYLHYILHMKYLASLVKRGGKLLLMGPYMANAYKVGEVWFKCIPVNEEDIREAAKVAGLSLKEFKTVPWRQWKTEYCSQGYSAILDRKL